MQENGTCDLADITADKRDKFLFLKPPYPPVSPPKEKEKEDGEDEEEEEEEVEEEEGALAFD